jgi:hypothetical protein
MSGLFKFVKKPYHEEEGTLFLFYQDYSLRPCSLTRSCNEQFNSILDRYEIISYELYSPEYYCLSFLIFNKKDYVNLYNDLRVLTHLFTEVTLALSGCSNLDKNGFSETKENYLFERGFKFCEAGVVDNQKPEIVVFPNPTHNCLHISGINPHQIILYDWQGKTLFVKIDKFNEINIKHLPNGIYLLHVISDNGAVYVSKIIKE